MEQEKNVTVSALMTAPRYESVWARTQIERALTMAGVPLTISGGVFYGQCMQMMLEQLADTDVDYVITVDFDSIFTAKHVNRLLSIVVQEKLDALAAIQAKRGSGEVLGSRTEENEVQWSGKPIQVRSAHFGLTVLDMNRIREVEKPWFVSQPDVKGSWSADKIDDDVYFWRKWERAGHKVFIDPGTRLGHLEEVVTVFDDQMNKHHWYPKEWESERDSTVD